MTAQRELGLIREYDAGIAAALEGARLAEWRLRQIRRCLQQGKAVVVRDLRIHLKDRDAHIRNLEAQLRPYLVDHADPPQEAML